MKTKKILEPSLLAFTKKLLSDLNDIIKLGIKQVHFDFMDGEYVENISLLKISDLKIITKKINVSIHIMGYNFLTFAKKIINYPIAAVTFQFEAALRSKNDWNELKEALIFLKANNIKCGIAINPNTNYIDALPFIEQSDIITVMSVVAGKGGQKFDQEVLNKLKWIKQYKQKNNQNLIIQIDGGINLDNLPLIINDVDWVVSGTAFYNGSVNDKKNMIKLVQND